MLFLASSFVWSSYTVMTRKHAMGAIPRPSRSAYSPRSLSCRSTRCFAWTGLVVSHLREAPWSEIIFQAVVQGIGSVVISGITFVRMVETFGPIRSTMITAVVPGLSALGAVLFLASRCTGTCCSALPLVTVGIVFGVKPVTPVAHAAATTPCAATGNSLNGFV